MEGPIRFEIDLAGLGLGDERKGLIRDRLTAAVIGYAVGDLGRIESSDWRGDRLVFEYRPGEELAPECVCGSAPEVCIDCAEQEQGDAYERGRLSGIDDMRNAVDTLLDEVDLDHDLDTRSDTIGAIRGRLEDLEPEG